MPCRQRRTFSKFVAWYRWMLNVIVIGLLVSTIYHCSIAHCTTYYWVIIAIHEITHIYWWPEIVRQKTNIKNSSTELCRNTGPWASQLQITMLKSNKIWCKSLLVNYIGLQTFWMTLIEAGLYRMEYITQSTTAKHQTLTPAELTARVHTKPNKRHTVRN